MANRRPLRGAFLIPPPQGAVADLRGQAPNFESDGVGGGMHIILMARLLPNRLIRFPVDLVAHEPSDVPRLRGSGVSRLEGQAEMLRDGVHVFRPRVPVVRGAPPKLRQALPHGIGPDRRQHPRLSARCGASLLHLLLQPIDVMDDRCEDLDHPVLGLK